MGVRYLAVPVRAGLVAVVCGVLTMPAHGATISRLFTFNIPQGSFLFGAPAGGAQGSFTLTWDNSINQANDTTTGLSLLTYSGTLGSALGYQYFASTDQLIVGGTENGVPTVFTPSNDFALTFTGASTSAPSFSQFVLATGDQQGFARSGSITSVPFAVPEPLTMSLLGIGLLGLGIVGAARRQPAAR